jgi:hypothetical protein
MLHEPDLGMKPLDHEKSQSFLWFIFVSNKSGTVILMLFGASYVEFPVTPAVVSP